MIARYENFVVNQKASIFVSYVIKEFAHALSCAYVELWMHLGSLFLKARKRYLFDSWK